MTDWKGVKEALERRKEETGIALLGLVIVLSGIVLFYTRPDTKPAPVASVATSTVPDAYAKVPILAKAAIVYDLSTGRPLFERNADAQLPLASLTKLLTTFAAADALSPATPVTVTDQAIAQDGDSGLTAGETFTFNDIARFALVASSNDAAEAIALAAENHRVEDTQTLLRNAAAAANLSQTYAVNGTGLDESATVSGGYGSARDVARLAGALLAKAPAIAHATTESSITVTSLEGRAHSLPNTDIEVDHFPNLLLSKTGYTDLAGGNLAIVFDVGINHPVAIVVLGSTEAARFTDVTALVSATLDHFGGVAASSLSSTTMP